MPSRKKREKRGVFGGAGGSHNEIPSWNNFLSHMSRIGVSVKF